MLTFIAESLDGYLKLREENRKLQEEIQQLKAQNARSAEQIATSEDRDDRLDK